MAGGGTEQLAALADAGRLRVPLEECCPLEPVAAAHATPERQGTLGKLLLAT